MAETLKNQTECTHLFSSRNWLGKMAFIDHTYVVKRGRYPGERRPRSSDDYGGGEEGEERLAKFVNKQESYIQQLENENQYFRQQVVAVLR